MRKLLLVAGVLVLSGCEHFAEDRDAVATQVYDDAEQIIENNEKDGVNIASKVRDQVKITTNKLREWIITPLPPKPGPKTIAASYCYRALQDILCYRQPMPGWESRLVAYQGTNAAPPTPATMQLLPKPNLDESTLPENRVASSKPVFETMPAPIHDEAKNSDVPTTLDATHEQLPDPALAPQL